MFIAINEAKLEQMDEAKRQQIERRIELKQREELAEAQSEIKRLRTENERLKEVKRERRAQVKAEANDEGVTFAATAYTAYCDGCTGETATGIDVRNKTHHNGVRIIATDPSVIPLGSTVEIRFSDGTTERAVALDKGGAIKGRKIDYLASSTAEANRFGVQSVKIRIINEG